MSDQIKNGYVIGVLRVKPALWDLILTDDVSLPLNAYHPKVVEIGSVQALRVAEEDVKKVPCPMGHAVVLFQNANQNSHFVVNGESLYIRFLD